MAIVWTAVPNRIDSNDLLQIQRPNDIGVMCMNNLEPVTHLFLSSISRDINGNEV